jgi:hypothetical protein
VREIPRALEDPEGASAEAALRVIAIRAHNRIVTKLQMEIRNALRAMAKS